MQQRINTRRTDINFKETTVFTFSCDSNRNTSTFQKPENLNLGSETDEKSCKICLDTGSSSSPFIHPCKCAGSVKYVHEECLKTWLISLGKDLEHSKCELCQTNYKMKFHIMRRCLPRESCKNASAHCIFIPILFSVLLMLFLIIYLLASKYFNSSSTAEERAYTIALALICFIAGIFIMAILINSIAEACYAKRLENWSILSQSFAQEQEKELTAEELARLEEMRKKNLVIPKVFRIKGKKVRLPQMRQMLTPVSRGDRIVPFSPKFFTPMGKVQPSSQEFNAFDCSITHHREESFGRVSEVELLKK